jgi:hypothetical protein
MQNRNYVNVFTYIIWDAIFNTALSTKEAPKILFIFFYKVQCTNCSSYFEVRVYSMLPTVKKVCFLKCIRNMQQVKIYENICNSNKLIRLFSCKNFKKKRSNENMYRQ